jgi:hypothetical protein
MQNHMPKLEAMLIVILIAAWVGGWVTPVAGAKKPPPHRRQSRKPGRRSAGRPPAPLPIALGRGRMENSKLACHRQFRALLTTATGRCGTT